MPYAFPEIKKFLGLFAQANSFGLPDGAMERALNIVINDDDVISKTRGFYNYFVPNSGTLKALFTYQDRLMALYTDKIAYYTDTGSSPNETGVETPLTGEPFTISSDRVPVFVETNGNLYFTTDNGVMKIDAYNGKVFLAGAPPALDMRGNLLAANGIFNGDSGIAYRVVFGRRDANQNLILGAPSDILTLTNAKRTNQSYSHTGGGPHVVTVTSVAHGLTTGMIVTVTDATDVDANGNWPITVVTPDTFTYTTTPNPGSGTLSWAASKQPILEFSIPSEITTTADAWFWQLYRTSQTNDADTTPLADFRLIEEKLLTASDLTTGFITYIDTIDEVLVEFAPELYTNPNSREGELQANARPPLCDDMTLFQNSLMFGNCTTRQFVDLDVVDAAVLPSGSWIELQVAGGPTRRYLARNGIGNTTTFMNSFTGDKVNYTAHGFENDDSVFVNTVSGALLPGLYFVVNRTANDFELSTTEGGSAASLAGTTSFWLQGVTGELAGVDYPMFTADNNNPSVAAGLRNTAQGIVRAVNRDDSSVLIGNYTSSITDIPGKMRFSAKGFGGVISIRANSSTVGGGFFPVLPTAFSGSGQVTSTNDAQPNAVYISKVGEPEAVPLLNFIPVGSRNGALKRILALRNAVTILKADGVFKITGDNVSNFTSTLMDGTIVVLVPSSAVATDNRVFFLATEGICIATDSSVEIVSRRIENRIEPIVGVSTLVQETAALGYDSDRTYRISTLLPNETTKTITYIYNTVNDTWTESDVLFSGGIVGPNNTLYIISNNRILKERKKGNRIDFSGQNYSVTVNSVASDKLSASILSSSYAPMPGDIIVKGSVFTRIVSATSQGSGNYLIRCARQTNLVAADAVILYQRIVSEVRMAPFHAGAMGRTKQFAQLQLHTRTPSINRIAVTFSGQTFGGSEETVWLAENVAQAGGWGFDPWGYFPWGQGDGIVNQYTTQPAPVVRLYVPLFQQRNTFIQTYMVHREAGEAIEIQTMAWAVRAYQERVTK